MTSPFDWRNQPRQTKEPFKRHVVANPNSMKFHGTPSAGSIATPEKTKQQPAHGAFKTA